MNSGKVVGLFPAAIDPADKTRIVSHPGATYGGIVRQGWLSGPRMVDAMTDLRRFYADRGYRKLLYKVVPFIHTRAIAQDDSYALFRQGANRVRCDLSCAINLTSRLPSSTRRRRGLKKALKRVTLSNDLTLLGDLWEVLAKNLNREYLSKPVHSLEELQLLQSLFPDQIFIRCALVEGKTEAGVVFFNSPIAWHAQYIGSSELGYDVSALDAVFDSAISEAQRAGASYFDFGTSNENEGRILNEGLYRFKVEFGGGGMVHEFYELEL